MMLRERPIRNDLLLLAFAFLLAWSGRHLLLSSPVPGLEDRWASIPAQVPLRMTSLSGSLSPRPNTLSLDHFEGLATTLESPLEAPLEVSVRVVLPTSGMIRLELFPPEQQGRSSGMFVTLDVGSEQRTGISGQVSPAGTSGTYVRGGRGATTSLDARAADLAHSEIVCREAGFAPLHDDAWRQLRVSLESGQVAAELDGVRFAQCQTDLWRLDRLEIRSGLRRILIDDVRVEKNGQLLIDERFTHPMGGPLTFILLLTLAAGALWGLRWLETTLLCRRGLTPRQARATFAWTLLPLLGLLLIVADLQPILEALRLGLTPARPLVFAMFTALTLLTKVCHHLALPTSGPPGRAGAEHVEPGRADAGPRDAARTQANDTELEGATPHPGADPMTGVRRTLVTVIWIELLASAVLGDGPYRWLYVLLAGGALPVGWILLLTLRSTIPVRELTRVELAIALLMGGFAAGKLVSLAGSPSGMGSIVGGWGGAWMPLALLGLCLQLFVRVWVLNVNGSRARDTNLVSLVLVAAGLFALESAARHTYLEASLDDSDNYSVFAQFDHITRVRVHRDWPDKLFPIAFPARRPDVRQRIVCLGGSSTAGAYQMKELSLFYPFRLQLMLNETPALRTTEVLNQGVGGWNTFLIRKYLESTIDPLAPDLVTLYVGHNDMLTRLPATYRDFWEQYSRGASLERTVQSWLNRSRLYVLYKQMLLARTQYRTRAVPIPDARDNLLAITDLVAARGGRVLLLSEGLSPDPGPLESYFEMMRSFAGSHDGVYYFDAAGSLKNLPQHEVFFDDCHLTPYGHALLAGAILEYLRANPSLLQPADGDTGVPEQEPR